MIDHPPRRARRLRPDLLDCHFLAAAPDGLRLADITYVPTREGFHYLYFILDACTRRVVGWSMANHLRAELVIDALEMALSRRRPPSGVVHNSDRGSQYTPYPLASLLKRQASSLRWGGWDRHWTS